MKPNLLLIDEFIDQLTSLQFANVFNPYTDICSICDNADAPLVRRNNLKLVLHAALRTGVDSLWIGRDLGYRGGRRTGLALTDEIHLAAHAALYGIPSLARATKGSAVAERTATVIWQALNDLRRPIFLWNIFPFHPYEQGNSLSNRCHSHAERQSCRPLLLWLLHTLRPKAVIAIGRDAQIGLTELDIAAYPVRHPSYGGQADFVKAIDNLYGRHRPPKPESGQLF
jgi:hypothetical protein